MKDIEKDLIGNDPREGSQTDRNTQKSNEAESDKFQTIAPEKDNPVEREFEIREPENDEFHQDELTKDETDGTSGNTKSSQRNFYAHGFNAVKNH
ncbi:hypothetical protein BKM63_17055 [Flavobacterium johnsoniae]|uniref:Uncharacterized protein n=1 Tax=Flavobacterium johnsoniae TaxID=986 RepID=A0A1J7BPF3_FLAJO|nr:hypothetical protein BKM63_17055 [Flavobacterium johnsoniae]